MEDILYRAASYLLLILLGVVLKKKGFFTDRDFRTLAKVLLNITLPCAIIYTFSKIELRPSLLFLLVFSFGCGLFMFLLAYLQNKLFGRGRQLPFELLNLSGYNIGNFCIPFAQSFLAPLSMLAISLFDTANSFFCNGGAKAVAEVFKNRHLHPEEKISVGRQLLLSLKTILRALSRSTPFITYTTLLLILILHIPIPRLVISFSSIGANANACTAMLMIGVGFKLKIKREGFAQILRILLVRYGFTVSMALVSYFLLPFELQVRQALVLAFLSPIASAAPAYTELLGEDFELSSTINSIAMLCSICLITGALILML